MELAFKAGVGAFKVGKIAANTGKALRELSSDVILWEIQTNYYREYFNSKRAIIPVTLYALGAARVEVARAYLVKLKERIARAQVGKKKTQVALIAKASGEMGRTFSADMAAMFVTLEETFQMIAYHLNSLQQDHIHRIFKHLELMGNPVPDINPGTYYLSPALDITVESRRFIFILEWPVEKVHAGETIVLKWTVAGSIPACKIELQTASLIQQAQAKAKKSYTTIAESVPCNSGSVSEYEWTVPESLIQTHGSHGSYSFRFTYENPELLSPTDEIQQEVQTKKDYVGGSLVGNKPQVNMPVKAISETFKISLKKDKDKPKEDSGGALSNMKTSIGSAMKGLPSLPGSKEKALPATPPPAQAQEKQQEKPQEKPQEKNAFSKGLGMMKKKF